MKCCCKEKVWLCLCVLVFWSLQEFLSKVFYMQCLTTCRERTKNKQSWKSQFFSATKFVILTRKPLVLSRISIIFSFFFYYYFFIFLFFFWLSFWLSKLSVLIIIFCFLWRSCEEMLSQMFSDGIFPRKPCLSGR